VDILRAPIVEAERIIVVIIITLLLLVMVTVLVFLLLVLFCLSLAHLPRGCKLLLRNHVVTHY
jgi:hypothetical protein